MYDLESDELREQVARGVKRQKVFYRWLSLGMSALFFAISVLILATTPRTDNPGDMLTGPAILWAATLIFHFVSVLIESGVMDKQIASQVVARELGRQFMANQANTGKRKREAANYEAMTVDDEGELIPLYEDEASAQLGTRK